MATLQEILADETTAKEFFAQETPEAALAYLQGKGVEISMEEFKTELEKMAAEAETVQSGELSEDDLEKVAGGMYISLFTYERQMAWLEAERKRKAAAKSKKVGKGTRPIKVTLLE